MSIVNDIKKLVAASPLFVEEAKLAPKSKRGRKGKYGREAVKIGQGGTLDPLADGVLGNLRRDLTNWVPSEQACSYWCGQRYEKAV